MTAQLRILLVDDDRAVRESMRMLVELSGHVVTTADGGANAIAAFGAAQADGQPFPVVITDLGMPDVDGYGVAAKHDDLGNVDETLEKPIRLAQLRQALARCGEQSQA